MAALSNKDFTTQLVKNRTHKPGVHSPLGVLSLRLKFAAQRPVGRVNSIILLHSALIGRLSLSP